MGSALGVIEDRTTLGQLQVTGKRFGNAKYKLWHGLFMTSAEHFSGAPLRTVLSLCCFDKRVGEIPFPYLCIAV